MIYEWRCEKCGFTTEVSRPVNERNTAPYPTEAKHTVTMDHGPIVWKRVLSTPNVPFESLRRGGVFADDNGNFAPRKI